MKAQQVLFRDNQYPIYNCFFLTFAGPSTPILTWLKDDASITSTDRVVQYEGTASFGLEITNIQPSDAGLYSCLGYTVGEDDEQEICNFQLIVLGKGAL